MKISSRFLIPSVLVALVACSSDAGDESCLVLPCPLTFAVDLTVTSVTGAVVPNVTVMVTGEITGGAGCNDQGHCFVPGGAGTYNLSVSAPGFATVTRTVQVFPPDDYVRCGCSQATEQHVTVALPSA